MGDLLLKANRERPCRRSGFIKLTHKSGRVLVAKTVCKTWGCNVCRKSLLSLVKMKMEYGCLTLGRFWLTTVTLKQGSRHGMDASSVRKVWEPWLQVLKVRNPNLSWMKIVELTKAGTPHMHVLMGGLSKDRVDCCYRVHEEIPFSRRFITDECPKDCLMHEMARAWLYVTGDSFVVDCREGYSPARLANYLGKYLVKGFEDRQNLKAMGWLRRYSSSQNWPKLGRLETEVQRHGGWESVEMVNNTMDWRGFQDLALRDSTSVLLKKTGDDLRIVLGAFRKNKAGAYKLGKMIGERVV